MLKQVIMNQNFSAQEYLIKIAKLLTDKINLVEDVIEYSNQEAKGLSNKDIEFLDKLGESKNSKIKKINRIDSAFLNFFEKVKMLENVKSFEELSIKRYPILFDIRIETEKIQKALKKLSEKEKKNQSLAKSMQLELQNNIRNINQTKMTNNAYKPKSPKSPSYYIDTKK
jgi:hypothetical protein